LNIFFHHKIPVFVGFGSCIDIFVSATKLFKEIGLQPPDGTKEYGVLNDESQFKEEFFFYFSKGAAAERYVADRQLFDRLVEASRKVNAPVGLGKSIFCHCHF